MTEVVPSFNRIDRHVGRLVYPHGMERSMAQETECSDHQVANFLIVPPFEWANLETLLEHLNVSPIELEGRHIPMNHSDLLIDLRSQPFYVGQILRTRSLPGSPAEVCPQATLFERVPRLRGGSLGRILSVLGH